MSTATESVTLATLRNCYAEVEVYDEPGMLRSALQAKYSTDLPVIILASDGPTSRFHLVAYGATVKAEDAPLKRLA